MTFLAFYYWNTHNPHMHFGVGFVFSFSAETNCIHLSFLDKRTDYEQELQLNLKNSWHFFAFIFCALSTGHWLWLQMLFSLNSSKKPNVWLMKELIPNNTMIGMFFLLLRLQVLANAVGTFFLYEIMYLYCCFDAMKIEKYFSVLTHWIWSSHTTFCSKFTFLPLFSNSLYYYYYFWLHKAFVMQLCNVDLLLFHVSQALDAINMKRENAQANVMCLQI